MNRNSWLAVGILAFACLAVFGIFWTLPRHDPYPSQEKRLPMTDARP